MIRSPFEAGFSYDGGKGGAGVYQTIINQMPPHRRYIEPFLGGGAVMRHKRPALESFGFDLDTRSVILWDGGAGQTIVGLEVQQTCGVEWMVHHHRKRWFRRDDLVYCDPPYLLETRRGGAIYNCEMDAGQHRALIEVLLKLPCLVMVSGYQSEMYSLALAHWRRLEFQTTTRGGSLATEVFLWMNYPEPRELHDYSYLGGDYRERERIKKKRVRWREKLLRMEPLERLAVLAAVEEIKEN